MKFLNEINGNETEFHNMEYVKYCLFIFIIGGVFGCLAETLFTGIIFHQWIKPGFLYGLFVPIYGWGALCIFLLLKRFKKSPRLFTIMTMLTTGLLEGLTGYFMLQIWHRRWWDYSNDFLNIGGFVCLYSVSLFAIVGLFFIYVVEPLLNRFYTKLSPKQINIICISFLVLYIIDNIFSFAIRNQF